MSEAPERIWATDTYSTDGVWINGVWQTQPNISGWIEYVRTDIAASQIAEALVDRVLDVAGDYMGAQYGNTALHHRIDRERIKAALAQEEQSDRYDNSGRVEYLRADIAASLQEQVETLTKERDQLQKISDSKVISSRNLHTVSAEAAEAERDRWKGEYLNACRDAASFSDDLVKAEAERDRLAADVARLREVLERVLNAAGCGVDLYNDGPGKEAIRNARAALAGKE